MLLTAVAAVVIMIAGSADAQTLPGSLPAAPATSHESVDSARKASETAPRTELLQEQVEGQQQDIANLIKAVEGLTAQLRQAQAAIVEGTAVLGVGQPAGPTLAAGEEGPGRSPSSGTSKELQEARREFAQLDAERLVVAQAPAPDKLEKQLEVQRKELEILNKMVKLMAAELAKLGPAVAKMQTQVAGLDSSSKQAAQRDRELGNGLDNLTEHVDADRRNGPWLPAPLKELFDPSYNNETPLSIYGALVEDYTQFHPERWGVFSSPTLSTFFLLTLNERILLEANVDTSNTGVAVPWAQMDFWLTDWLTLVVGRYLVPIGFYNERLAFEWGNRLPDDPLMFHQVSPLIASNGLQLRGATYLCGSPVKLEYSVYFGNGMELSAPPAALADVADLDVLAGSDETHAKAFGGRVGLWVPEYGINGGISGYYDYNYAQASPTVSLSVLSLDASYHQGDWDLRFEAACMNQQTSPIIGRDIERAGLYAQAAYRAYDSSNRFLQRLELVGRYSMERFKAIDASMLDFTTFSDPTFVPVDRNQYTLGINYYVYPSLIFKLAYEINQELHGINLNDNVFFGQVVWAF
jgi:hypothetical protein